MKIASRFLLFVIVAALSTVAIAQENRLQIVASHSILGDVVQNIAGDAADISITLPAGADPHSFQPIPADLVELANADVVFVNGAFFEEGLIEAIENADSDMNIVAVSVCIELLDFEGHAHEDHEHGEHDDDEEHDDEDHSDEEHEEHDDEDHSDEEHEHDDQDHSDEDCEQHHAEIDYTINFETIGTLHDIDCDAGCDPHVWMLPENVMLWTVLIRDTLIELDPDNSAIYTDNAASYLQELSELSETFILPMLDSLPVESRLLVTNHDSLAYFAAGYDFEIVSTVISGGSTVAEPGAADIVSVIDLINERQVLAIFAENTISDDVVRQISDETGVEIALLYSGSLSEDDTANTYLDYMRYNVTTIVSALGN